MISKLLIVAAWTLVATAVSAQSMTLDAALRLARSNRQTLKAADLIVQATASQRRADSTYPAPSFGSGISSRPDIGATDQDLFVEQTIDIFGRTSAARRVGNARVAIARADYRQTVLEVQDEVLVAFSRAVAAARSSQVAKGLLTIATTLNGATTRRFEEGKVPEIQAKRTSIELARAQSASELRQAQYEQALRRLAGAIGITEIPAELEAATIGVRAPRTILGRPDVERQTALIDEAEAQRVALSRSNLPDLSIAGIRSPWQERSGAFGARLQLTWRGLDFGRGANERRALAGHASAARAALNDLKTAAQAELDVLEGQIKVAQEQVEFFRRIRTATIDLVEKSQRGFSEGYGNLLDVLEATRSLREIEQELIEAELAHDLAMAAEYLATGTVIEVNP